MIQLDQYEKQWILLIKGQLKDMVGIPMKIIITKIIYNVYLTVC